jgi:hypothetical protein
MAKAVGVGGVFFKAADPKALSQWYETRLGIGGRVSGDSLTFDGPESMGMTVFAQFPANTGYFGDGHQSFPGGRPGWFAGATRVRGCAH